MKIKAASVQMESLPGDRESNWRKIEKSVREAAAKGVKLIAFPECCVSGYWFLRKLDLSQLEALAEDAADGYSARKAKELAMGLDMVIGVGILELAANGKIFNTYLVAMPDGRIEKFRKLHAFVNKHLSSGDEYAVFDTPHGYRAAVLICYDNNLVENPRICALKGAQVILAPHQTGGTRNPDKRIMGVIERKLWDERKSNPDAIRKEILGPKGRDWLVRWLPARAYDNGVFYLFSNGVGVDDDEIRTGNATIVDPQGCIIAETSEAEETMVIAELDFDLVKSSLGQTFITARRPDIYTPLTEQTGREINIFDARFKDV